MGWYNASWGHRIKITVQNTKVDADINNFPIYVDLNDLPASFHSNVKSDGGDIRVTKSDGTTEVPREVVFYDSGTDTGALHFKGDILNSSDVDFYIYYGNAGASDYATDATYGAENVWDSNYKAVWHLHESSGTQYDSTQYDSDFTTVSVTGQGSAGFLGGGNDLEQSSSNYMSEASANANLAITSDLTLSGWINVESLPSTNYECHVIDRDNTGGTRGYHFGPFNDSGTLRIRFNINGGTWIEGNDSVLSDTGLSLATSYYIVCTHDADGSPPLTVYVDGLEDGTQNSSSGSIGDSNVATVCGPRGEQYYDGLVGELRISNTPRSATWVSTEYNNQSSPSTFYQVAAAAESPSASPSLSPSHSPSLSPSASVSLSPSASISLSPSLSLSLSPSTTPSSSVSLSPSLSPSASISLSLSLSPSLSPSASVSLSPSVSASASISLSPSVSISLSPSLSPSVSVSLSPSLSVSLSPSASISLSPSLSPSASPSPSTGPSNYWLNGILIPRPNSFSREYLDPGKIVMAISGKWGRDITSSKEVFNLTWEYMWKEEYDNLIDIINLNQAITFKVEDGNLQIIETNVFPYIKVVDYEVPGEDYLAGVTLGLIEET